MHLTGGIMVHKNCKDELTVTSWGILHRSKLPLIVILLTIACITK